MQATFAANRHPWEVYVVNNKEKLQELSEVILYAGMTKDVPAAIVAVYQKESSRIGLMKAVFTMWSNIMMKEFLDIVDENGQPTGAIVDREIAHANGIWHRTSHVWLVRRKKGKIQILLQKRAGNKSSFLGCYDISSAGHIPAGEDCLISAIRELKEELGVQAEEADLIYCGDRKVIWDDVFFGKPFHDRQISRVFLLWLDRDECEFTLQESEVDSVLWMEFDRCYEGVKNDLFQNCIVQEELEMIMKALHK